MSFINEYVSEEDIQKYQLDDLWNDYVGIKKDIILPAGRSRMPDMRLKGYRNLYWIINRTTNNWLMFMKDIRSYENSRSGLLEPTGEKLFCFYWNNQYYSIILKVSDKSTKIYKADNPYNIIWEFVAFTLNPNFPHGEEEIVFWIKNFEQTKTPNVSYDEALIKDLKSALVVYGDRGMEGTIPNASVYFEF